MSEINWTQQQLTAIREVHRSVLATAAAGGGKTAVLAQRCTHLLSQADPRANVEDLLVLTFNDSAANEMRRRIREAFLDQVKREPAIAGGVRQLALLDQAKILTIHAFCSTVIREYFYLLSLDPAYEILDADEADLLKTQAAHEVFEGFYNATDRKEQANEIHRFLQIYGSDISDRDLIYLLTRLHNFLGSLGDRSGWLKACQQQPQSLGLSEIKSLHIVRRQREILLDGLDRALLRFGHALKIEEKFSGARLYGDYLQRTLCELKELQRSLKDENDTEAMDKLKDFQFSRLPSRPRGTPEEVYKPVKDFIGKAKDSFKAIQQKYVLTNNLILKQLTETLPHANVLITLHGEFARRYEQIKQHQRALDFNDLEHQCLLLLQNHPEVALQLHRRYKYILVDEYQDISPIQEEIIRSIHESGAADGTPASNLFMVGDVKQSIYGFRRADPDIFLDKLAKYAPASQSGKAGAGKDVGLRIELNKNFRSRRGIIEGINTIFSRCMTKPFCGVDYEGDAQLVFGAEDYYTIKDATGNLPSSQGCDVEIHLIESKPTVSDVQETPDDQPDHEDAKQMDKREVEVVRREAQIIARRIRRMVGSDDPDHKGQFQLLDPASKLWRDAAYRDIVILLRSMKGRAEIWNEVFQHMRIPVSLELRRGFFEATEIQDMICLLRLIDNIRQDISLASVLRSPIVGLNETQLARIRLSAPQGSYEQAVRDYAKQGPDKELADRLSQFLDQLGRWQRKARQKNLSELIWEIYRQSGLLGYVLGLKQGKGRHGNLLALHDRACQFDRFARQGLNHFLRFIDQLQEEEGDFGPARVLTESQNVVRIMSIHHSKGLEFPVVIVGDLGRRVNKHHNKDRFLFDHREPGSIGLKIVDPLRQDRWDTLAYRQIADDIQRRQLAEEMRLLYVAMTRPGQRLILAASLELSAARQNWSLWRFDQEDILPEFALMDAKTPMDWIAMALAGHRDFQKFLDVEPVGEAPDESEDSVFDVAVYPGTRLQKILEEEKPDVEEPSSRRKLEDVLGCPTDEDLEPEVRSVIARIDWRYPHESLCGLLARTSVTDLKHRLDVEREPDFIEPVADRHHVFLRQPRFISEQLEEPTPAQVGSWTHLFLRHLDLADRMDATGLSAQLNDMVKRRIFTERQGRTVDLDSVARLFADSMGRDIITGRDALEHEWTFTLAVPAGELYSDFKLTPEDRQERVLVRGIIDCLFRTDQGVVIVDYKTDDIDGSQCDERAATYRIPMNLYRRAVETILSAPVVEMYLYFLKPTQRVSMIS